MMVLQPSKKIYFISDFHLGAPNAKESLQREKKIIRFLNTIQTDAQAIFIMGDMFDFWFEYKTVVPKGYTRLLGKLAELTDAGIDVIFFVGNHDMWMKDYFKSELNIQVYHHPQIITIQNKTFFLAHGDGLGPGDKGYKMLKKIFRNPLCQWLFGLLHPTWGMGLANYFSRKSREKTGSSGEVFLGEENEWLIVYSKAYLKKQSIHYFVYGHRHLPLQLSLSEQSQYINLGDWIRNFTYAVFDGENMHLKKWQE